MQRGLGSTRDGVRLVVGDGTGAEAVIYTEAGTPAQRVLIAAVALLGRPMEPSDHYTLVEGTAVVPNDAQIMRDATLGIVPIEGRK